MNPANWPPVAIEWSAGPVREITTLEASATDIRFQIDTSRLIPDPTKYESYPDPGWLDRLWPSLTCYDLGHLAEWRETRRIAGNDPWYRGIRNLLSGWSR